MLFGFSKKENNSNKNNSKLTKRNVFCKLFSCVILSLLLTCIACFNFDDYYVYGDEAPLYTDNYDGRVVKYYTDKVVIDGEDASITPTEFGMYSKDEDANENSLFAYFYEDDTNDIHTVVFTGSDSTNQDTNFANNDTYKSYIKNVKCAFAADGFTPKSLKRAFYCSEGCPIERIDFSKMNKSELKYASYMFNNCKALTNIDKDFIDLTDCPILSEIYNMFEKCSNLEYIDIDIFEGCNNITDLHSLFNSCTSLETIDNLDSFVTSKMTDFSKMFYSCRALKYANLNSGKEVHPTKVRDMFRYCDALEKIDISNFVLDSDTLLTMESGESRYNYDLSLNHTNNINLYSIKLPKIDNDGITGNIGLLVASGKPWLAYKDGIKVNDTEYITLISKSDSINYLKTYNDDNPLLGVMYSETINASGEDITRHYFNDKVLDEDFNEITGVSISNVELCDTTKNTNDNRLKVYFYEDETNDIHTAIFEGVSNEFIGFHYKDNGEPEDTHTQEYFDNMKLVKNVYASLNGFMPDNLNKLFYKYENIEYIDFSNMDTSNLGSLYKLFNSNTNLTKVDFGGKNLMLSWGGGFGDVFRKLPREFNVFDKTCFNVGDITVSDGSHDTIDIGGLFYYDDYDEIDFTRYTFTKPISNVNETLYNLKEHVKKINMSNLDLSAVTNDSNSNLLFRITDTTYNKGLEEIILPMKVPTNEDYAIVLPKNDGDIVWAGYNDDDEYNYEVYENLPAKIEGELTKVVRVDKNLLPEKPGPGPEPDPSPRHKKKKKEENKELEEVKEEVKEDDKEEIKKTIPNVLPTLKSDITPYLEGYDDGSFKPTSNMTRGEFAKVIASFINEYDINNDIEKGYNKSMALSYNDTDESLWSLDAIGFVSRCNLMTGDLNNFNSEDGISRAEVVKVLSLLFDAPDKGYSNTFIDELIGEWYEPYFDKFIKAGIVNGYDDGYLRPTEKITRMEVIILLNKLTNKDINNISDLDSKINDLTNRFNDVNKDDWFINELVLGFFK